MPGKDGTGPEGKGPMTGRGSAVCAKKKEKENEEFQFRGQRWGSRKQQSDGYRHQGKFRFQGGRK